MKDIIKKDILPVVITFVFIPVLMSLNFSRNDLTAISGIAVIQYFIISPIVCVVIGFCRGKRKEKLVVLSISIIIASIATSWLIIKVTILLTFIPIVCLLMSYLIGSIMKKRRF